MNNRLRPLLDSGKPQIGMVVMYPTPGAVERIGPDWDWIWIDGQHGEMGYAQIMELVRACNLIDRPALVRVSDHGYGQIGKVLDMGASGVIVPCVDTPAEAQAVVAAAKFPPLGNRSYGGRRKVDIDGRNYSDTANENTLCILQIESPEAIAHVAEIAAIPGVDALLLGPDDIMLRRGYGVNFPRDKESLGADMQAVANACRSHGKYAAMISVDTSMISLCAEMGYRLLCAGSDVHFLASGSRHASATARAASMQIFDGNDAVATSEAAAKNSPY